MSHLSEAHHCDRMKLLLRSLLLASLCALSSWSVSSELLDVTQSPDATVMEGETVHITCSWKSSTTGWVTWVKHGTQTNKNQSNNKTTTFPTSFVNEIDSSILTLTNVTKEDSAIYICNVTVDIPRLIEAHGKGTVITVKSKGTADDYNGHDEGSNIHSQPVHITLAVAAPLLLITLICFCCLRRKQAQAAKVIYEVPHFDSETQEMDKHDSSSRGSSQWCQVPVYESFDYFEHVETKKSG